MASQVEMLSGRRKKDYASEAAAEALATQAAVMGLDPDGPDFDDTAEGGLAAETEIEEAITVAA